MISGHVINFQSCKDVQARVQVRYLLESWETIWKRMLPIREMSPPRAINVIRLCQGLFAGQRVVDIRCEGFVAETDDRIELV